MARFCTYASFKESPSFPCFVHPHSPYSTTKYWDTVSGKVEEELSWSVSNRWQDQQEKATQRKMKKSVSRVIPGTPKDMGPPYGKLPIQFPYLLGFLWGSHYWACPGHLWACPGHLWRYPAKRRRKKVKKKTTFEKGKEAEERPVEKRFGFTVTTEVFMFHLQKKAAVFSWPRSKYWFCFWFAFVLILSLIFDLLYILHFLQISNFFF